MKGHRKIREFWELGEHEQSDRTKKVCMYKNQSALHTVNSSEVTARCKILPMKPETERKMKFSSCP